MALKKEFIYICEKCKNQLISNEETRLTCEVCGNIIDTSARAWSTHASKKSKRKINTIWGVLILSIILFSIKYCIQNEKQIAKEKQLKMFGLMNPTASEVDYSINTIIRLKKDTLPLKIFSNKEFITDAYIKEGVSKNLIIKILTYHSSNENYSNIKSSRDTIIKNYLSVVLDKVLIEHEDTTSFEFRYHSLLTKGTVVKQNETIGFNILSDYDSRQKKNWHLILIFEKNKDNTKTVESIINSRELGGRPNYVE